MKIGKLFIAFLFIFLSSFSWSQTINKFPQQTSSNIIQWIPPVKISILEGENAKTIAFEGADYLSSDNFLPRYSERIELKGNENNFSAAIVNAVYQPLNASETALITDKNKITAEITVTSKVLCQKKSLYGILSFIPLRKNGSTGVIEKLVSFTVQINPEVKSQLSLRSSRTYAANSVLQSGKWYKIAAAADGVFKISYSFLASLGINMTAVDPKNLRVYGNGGGMLPELNSVPRIDDLAENAIYVEGESDGIFNQTDFALFYGTSPNTWKLNPSACGIFTHQLNLYSDSAYYFITFDLGPGKRIQTQASAASAATHIVTSFDDHAFIENEAVNYIKSGRNWYGEYFDNIASYNFPFSFPNIDVSAAVSVKTILASRLLPAAGANASYNVSCQTGSTAISIPAVDNVDLADEAKIGSGCFSFLPSSPSVIINITKQTPAAAGRLDYLEVNARRQLIMAGSQMLFRDQQSKGAGNISEYNLTSAVPVQIWDITDPANVKLQNTIASGANYQFVLPSDSLHQFIAFNGLQYNIPASLGSVANQDLHALSNKNMLIVAHPDFYNEALDLASFHESHDSLSTAVVTPQQIYNEFSSGSQDISAIRDFVKMFYDKAGSTAEMPQYLLLFGDGSYDNKKRFSSNTNFIPTYQSFNSTSYTQSYVSDDFYGLLDDSEGNWNDTANDAVDLGIGRFPVKTKAEADAVLNKIFKYGRTGLPPTTTNLNSCGSSDASPFGDWRNVVCFIADDQDNNLHISDADQLAALMETSYKNYNVDKIYLDAYQQESSLGGKRYPAVNAAINQRLNKGALVVNYTGHGGEVGLAHERIVELSDINSWSNINALPLFFTATCEFSRFDDPQRTSAGEQTLLNPKGGAIALLTTVRVVYAQPNFVLNQDFYKAAFKPINGKMPRLGDLYYYIKNQAGGNSVNSRNFTLLGDPALRLAYPALNVSTDSINSKLVSASGADTIKALSYITVSGFVRDKNGAVLSNYNGVVYPTVFDKPDTITTLVNDPCPAPAKETCSQKFTFNMQKNVLYKGKVSVTNGYFRYSFIVPKDIGYNYGAGKISYYAENGTEDANGYYEKIIIGSTNAAAPLDNAGPEIKLYMNDPKFVFGGLTDEKPDIYALLKDNSGINTIGNGIGHDLVAVLDANTENSIVLNDFYQADLNSYKSGSVRYPFVNLDEGKHTLDMRAFDVYNNSSKAHTEFVAAKSAKLALNHVLNYPNPFTTRTSFYFEQNQSCQSLEVELQIFTVSGKLVKSISQFIYTEGYRSSPIEWDGRDDYGDKIGKGVYVYRIKVKTSEGQTAEQYEKLVILN